MRNLIAPPPAPGHQAVAVAGTKADGPGGARRVSEQEAREWAAARGLPYYEVRPPGCRHLAL